MVENGETFLRWISSKEIDMSRLYATPHNLIYVFGGGILEIKGGAGLTTHPAACSVYQARELPGKAPKPSIPDISA